MRPLFRFGVILTWISLCLPGCAQHPTEPVVAPVLRDVTVIVFDNLGVPVNWVEVLAMGTDPESGGVLYFQHTTGPDGAATFHLLNGAWTLSTGTFPEIEPMELRQIAGCTMVVPDRSSRPTRDTLVVRMRATTPSRIRGTVLLSGLDDPQYTDVWVKDCNRSGARTKAGGEFVLEGVPTGTWTLVCNRPGYSESRRTLVISVPGSDIAVPTVTLHP